MVASFFARKISPLSPAIPFLKQENAQRGVGETEGVSEIEHVVLLREMSCKQKESRRTQACIARPTRVRWNFSVRYQQNTELAHLRDGISMSQGAPHFCVHAALVIMHLHQAFRQQGRAAEGLPGEHADGARKVGVKHGQVRLFFSSKQPTGERRPHSK
jgi:hypothetical protein